jgi:signal transduction histidine kinase
VSHIVEAHHGSVTVSSTGERGSTFTMVLPQVMAEPAVEGASIPA